MGVAPTNVKVTVNLRFAVDTDHLILLWVRSSGSPKLSQPMVHFCVVCADAAPTDRSNAATSKIVFFISLLLQCGKMVWKNEDLHRRQQRPSGLAAAPVSASLITTAESASRI